MADLKRYVRLILDRASAEKTSDALNDALAKAGDKAGASFLRELRAQFARRMADLKLQLAQGLISPAQYKKQADLAARAFNTGLAGSIQKLRNEGKLTDAEFAKLGRSFKRTSDTGVRAAKENTSAWSRFKGVLAGIGALLAIDLVRRWAHEDSRRRPRVRRVGHARRASHHGLRGLREGNDGHSAMRSSKLRKAVRWHDLATIDLMVGLQPMPSLWARPTNVDEFAELAKTAISLGRALGVDAAFALESLSLGIGRQSKLILDNLGLTSLGR